MAFLGPNIEKLVMIKFVNLPSLTDLANKYGTDKGTVGPSLEWGANNYTDVYEAYVYSLRARPLNILEIGLGVAGDNWRADIVHGSNSTGGASIKMWHDYFVNAKIFGIDINPADHLDNDRISTMVVDQSSVDELQDFIDQSGVDEFDIIIDDGSHRPDHQQISLSFLFKFLKSGGLYFIEDISANGIGDCLHARHSCHDVLNTRTILKSFMKFGEFATPNAFLNEEYLASNVEMIRFHCPIRNENIPEPNYYYNSEKMCVIKKL